jgi:homoserine/homoserine lactone efflux protein
MAWDVWLLFLGTELVLSCVPGPAVLFVIAQGLRWGARRSLGASLGILAANACCFALSALGIGALLAARPSLLALLRWAGAAYVAWLGAAALCSRGAVAIAGAAASAPPTALLLLRRGAQLQFANPKALLFFAAILPGFVDPRLAFAPWQQVLVLGVTSVLAEFGVLAGYGALAARASARLQRPGFARAFDRAAGAVLLAVAAWIALRP